MLNGGFRVICSCISSVKLIVGDMHAPCPKLTFFVNICSTKNRSFMLKTHPEAKNKIFSVCVRDFHHEDCTFSWTDIHKKCSTTTRIYWEDGKSDIHVFPWQETPLENGIFSLFGTCFHLEESIFSWKSINKKCAGHGDVSFTSI